MRMQDYQLTETRGTQSPTVLINRKGLFSFNSTAAGLMDVKAGDEVVFSYDQDTFALFVRKDSATVGRKLMLRGTKSGKVKNLSVNSSEITADLFKRGGKKFEGKNSIRLPLSREPHKSNSKTYYQIVTGTIA